MMEKCQNTAKEMLSFIDKSPTCFHVVENLQKELEQAGYHKLSEEEDWTKDAYIHDWLKAINEQGIAEKQNVETIQKSEAIPVGKFYVTRNDSSLIAFQVPADWKGFHIVASHSDSPTFKVKEQPEIIVENQYVKLNTEKYGGMILSTWLDRPLSVAGRLVINGEHGLESRLVNLDEDLLVIPNVAIHLNRDTNKEAGKGAEFNPQVDMLPLFGDGSKEKGALLKKLAKAVGVKEEDILGHDLFLYVRDHGRILGAEGEFVLSPRLDDQQCVYSSITAFLESTPKQYLNVCAIFDNEEVGSGTKQGADSTFLEDALKRLCEALEKSSGDYCRYVAGGFLISADNAHAVHPNHPEKSDPTNRPYLNGGIVIKYHGSQKYTTDALSAAKLKKLCNQAEVPYQIYTNRSDIAGGSTLGNISTSHVSISSVDIGLPQLSMHSAVETAGSRDTEYAIRMFHEFYEE